MTTRLVATGEVLGIPVLDHIVVGHGRYFSFKEAGRLQCDVTMPADGSKREQIAYLSEGLARPLVKGGYTAPGVIQEHITTDATGSLAGGPPSR